MPNIFARDFALQPVTGLDDDGFHYKRIYAYADKPSDMRIFGFESREQLENILKKYDVSVKAESEVQWAKCVVSNIDDDFHYLRLNELFPQWKESLERGEWVVSEDCFACFFVIFIHWEINNETEFKCVITD